MCVIDPETYGWITGERRLEDSARDSSRSAHRLAWVREIGKSPEVGAVDYVPEFDRLVERVDIDAITLVVPDALHEPYAVQALEARTGLT